MRIVHLYVDRLVDIILALVLPTQAGREAGMLNRK